MALRTKKATHRPRTLADSQDGSNSQPGSMQLTTNLIPSQRTAGLWIPRPASVLSFDTTTAPGVTTAGRVVAELPVGANVFGMVQDTNSGTDKPFMWNGAAFVTITQLGIYPTTQSNAGDWVPPTMTMMPNGRIIVCHKGYPGTGIKFFGVIDTGGATITFTGNTHSNTLIDTLGGSFNPVESGIEVGMPISDLAGDIAAGVFVESFTATTITLSANATGSNATTFTVSGGSLAAPTYNAINTSGNPLVAVPLGCGLMAGRANYLVNNTDVQSDSLHSSQVTNASQVLTIGDNQNCTAIAQNSFTSQTQGGAIQSLIVFKGDQTPFQITGDTATQNLQVNSLNAPAGTLAPNSIAPTPIGLMYMSQDGLRFIDALGYIHEPIGAEGKGVNNPFINVVNPSRMAAAYNSNVYRISLTYTYLDGTNTQQTVTQEFWYHLNGKVWSGPHTFPADIIVASQAVGNHGFFAAAHGIIAKVWQSDALVTTASTYTENGTALSCEYATVLLPDNDEAAMNCVIETTIMLSVAVAGNFVATMVDDGGNVLDTVTFGAAQWDVSSWDETVWASVTPAQKQIFWHLPLVFKQAYFDLTFPAGPSVAVGNLYLPYEVLGYNTAQSLALSP